MGYTAPNRPIYYTPLPQRNEGTDQHNYRFPRPKVWAFNNYQSYWLGNRLPGFFIHQTAAPWNFNARSLDPIMPQRTQGSMGQQLGQQGSRNLLAQWGAAWSRLAGTGQ